MAKGNPNPSPATRFKPGQSGNPSGRPKGPTKLREIFHKEGWEEAIARRLYQIVQNGKDSDSRAAADTLYEKVFGRSPVLNEDGEVVSDVTFVIEMPKYEEPK